MFIVLRVIKGILDHYLINQPEKFVGVLVGAVENLTVESQNPGVVKTFSQCCFIPVGDMLRWASRVLGEKLSLSLGSDQCSVVQYQ